MLLNQFDSFIPGNSASPNPARAYIRNSSMPKFVVFQPRVNKIANGVYLVIVLYAAFPLPLAGIPEGFKAIFFSQFLLSIFG